MEYFIVLLNIKLFNPAWIKKLAKKMLEYGEYVKRQKKNTYNCS